jgi:predicted helicase
MTGNDPVTIHSDAKTLERTLKLFLEKPIAAIKEQFKIAGDTSNWTVKKAKDDVIKTKADSRFIRRILYRPFDKRVTFYSGNNSGFLSRPQFKVNSNMLFRNVGLLLPRQLSKNEFKHVFCSNLIPEMCAISTATKEQNQLFPLYLYLNASMDSKEADLTKEENFSKEFRSEIDSRYGKGISPEEILGYIYSVLHSPSYRKKYVEFLKIEFPRIPLAKDRKTFSQIAALGNELIQIHLLEMSPDSGYGDFIGKGDNSVEKINYSEDEKTGNLYINKNQYFTNVPKELYDFYIGGYQVIDKYLKERRGRTLTIDEVDNITSIINAVAFTIDQMSEIDKLTKEWV